MMDSIVALKAQWRSELSGLSIQDIDWKRELISIRQGKGGKDRYVPISKRALRWIKYYLDNARVKLSISMHQHALFLSTRGQAMCPASVTRIVTAYIKKSGIGKAGSSHLFRHTCATLMLENGAELCYVQ